MSDLTIKIEKHVLNVSLNLDFTQIIEDSINKNMKMVIAGIIANDLFQSSLEKEIKRRVLHILYDLPNDL